MELAIVAAAALAASLLTFFTGFGLGTLLLPVLALFMPPHHAVAATAVVHLVNNLVKLALVGRHADTRVLLRFALPAIPAAFLGALALNALAHAQPVARYSLAGFHASVRPLGIAMGTLIIAFGFFELSPRAERLAFPTSRMPLGGALSGFFGGLSGHQGALRTAFLLRAGLDKHALIATGVVAACAVDLTRLATYAATGQATFTGIEATHAPTILAACAAAATGAVLGSRLLTKVKLKSLRLAAAALMIAVGSALAAGLI